MKKNYLVNGMAILALAGGMMTSQAQTLRRCATMENLARLKQLDPDLEARMQDVEKQTQEVINNMATGKGGFSSVTATVYQIPVVVHVLYNTTAQNITDAQIQSQIDVLNEDFRRTNADKSNTPAGFASLAADCEIQFCLASVAPNGAATTGIVRKSTTVTSWSQDDAVKYSSSGGSDAWPDTKYLNIWVCNLGGGLLGYAQFPGGPAATDGVVINYKYFGRGGSALAPYNKGRTGSHEVGHWLNLYHIWGDDNGACTGSDQVSDTPNQGVEHYGCPAFPTSSCSNGANGDMFMNYMDYTDDACMNMLTLGQKTRMRALFNTGGAKETLLTSNGCGGTATPAYCAANGNSTQYEWINNVTIGGINNTTAASAGGYGNHTTLTATLVKGSAYTISLKPGFSGTAYTEYFKVYIDYNNDKDFADAGENVYTSPGSAAAVSGSITIPTTATAGTTRMRVMMSDAAIASPCGSMNYGEVEDYSVNITTATSSCGTPAGLTASSITSSSSTLGWTAVSGATSYNVRYKATSSTTWINTTSASNAKSVTGLTAGTQYEFQVQAVCSVAGAYSASAYFTTGASTVTSSYVTVGTGTTTTGATPYSSYYMDERTQFIITQAELSAAGWTSANSWLRSLAFYATTTSTQVLNGFTIKIASTTATSFASTSFLAGTFTTVYSGNVTVTANTWNTYNFTTAFNYSGSGSLLVEICWNNSSYTTNSSVQYTSTSAYCALYYRADVASGGVCANATGTQSYARPNMRMLFKNSATGKLEGEGQEAETAAVSALAELKLYPNPASDEVNVEFDLTETKQVNIRFIDMLGRVMLETTVEGQAGNNLVNFKTSALEQGNYIVVIGDAGEYPKKRLLISK